MNKEMTRFADAIYTKNDCRHLAATIFNRRELKVLLLVDGQRSVSEIAELLHSKCHDLMPAFGRLMQLGLIQTEGGIISADISGLLYQTTAPSVNNQAEVPHSATV